MSEENIIDTVCNRIISDKEIVEKNEVGEIEVDSFNLPDFWTQFGVAVQSLSNEVTKVGFSCGKTPFPSESEVSSMLQDLTQYYTLMKDFYLVLPKEIGDTLYRAITSAVTAIMSALLDFVRSLRYLTEKGAQDRLRLTGTFWDACNAVDSLPKNNLQATLNVLNAEEELAKDAQLELETTIAEHNAEEDDSWTESEQQLAIRALGLVKVARTCVSRLVMAVRENGDCSIPQNSAELDSVVILARSISPALDDFVTELYHPVDFPSVFDKGAKLVEVLRSLLCSVRENHFAVAFGPETINRLQHFISHNHHKLDPDNINPVPQLASLTM